MKTILSSLVAVTIAAGLANTARAQDDRFRTYGDITIKGHKFNARAGGGSAEACNGGNCTADFITVGQLNDRQWGPYANVSTADVFKRFGFLRGRRPTRWDCNIGLNFSTTNWISTSRCIDQIGSDKYEEIVRNLMGVRKLEEYKVDVLNKQFEAERQFLPAIITNASAAKPGQAIVFEVGNEPNVFPAMDPSIYAEYYKKWVDEIRRVAAAKGVPVKVMPAGLWIAEGMPDYLRNTLNQGINVAFGRITARVPTGVSMCGRWWAPYPCVTFSTIDLTSGVDIKARLFTNTMDYLKTFIAAVGPGRIDIGNLHFYPYVRSDGAYGSDMGRHIANLKELSSYYAKQTSTHQVWLTEMGNFNPFNEADTIARVATPMLRALKDGQVPELTRFYWFKNRGEDAKFKMLKSAGPISTPILAVAGLAAVKTLEAFLSPLITIIRPVVDTQTAARLGSLVDAYSQQNPFQGLTDGDEAGNGNRLRRLGSVYHNFALAPVPGAQCNGSQGVWNGCRGNGCAVCSETVAAFPKYFINHPNCARNPTCGGQFYTCNASCPEPDERDR